jgi:hypothetical protein
MMTMRGTMRAALVALALMAGTVGCVTRLGEREPTSRYLCFSEHPAGTRPGTPAAWRSESVFRLLFNGFDPSSGQVAVPLTDCLGTPILWQDPAPGECAEVPAPSTPLPMEPLTSGDMVVTDVRGGQKLIWAVARHFSDGEALGPVALVESTPRGLAVRALGTLRALPRNAKLRLEHVGSSEVLVAEGELCTQDNPGLCVRRARLMPLRGGRFVAEPLSTSEGKCSGPALFHLQRSATFRLPTGWTRQYEMTSGLQFAPDGLRVQEQLAVNDRDPKQPNAPPRLFRRAQGDRLIQARNGRLVEDMPSVWNRLVDDRAVDEVR